MLTKMKVTRYFEIEVLGKKRPYIKMEWCEQVIQNALHREVQPEHNRIRHFGFIDEAQKYLRVVTLEDGETIHNAFFDRDFKPRSH